MNIDGFAFLDLGLAFGVPLALLAWELASLRRAQRRDREAEQRAANDKSAAGDKGDDPRQA